MKLITNSSLAVTALVLLMAGPSNATFCSNIQKQILCVSYSDCSWVDGKCVSKPSETTDEALLENEVMNSRGWHHVGCVSQINSTSACQRKAAQYGYTYSRVQQDFMCPPKVLYSCYGSAGQPSENEGDQAYDSFAAENCSYYVKPAACVSHPECTWNGNCVPRK